MSVPPEDPRPAPSLRPGRRPRTGVALLLALLALPLVFALLPVDPGAVRVNGVALAWWYAGLFAPVLGLAIAAWAVPRSPSGEAPRRRQ